MKKEERKEEGDGRLKGGIVEVEAFVRLPRPVSTFSTAGNFTQEGGVD